MADLQHSAIPNELLHEPKDVNSASAGTSYVADGEGSGTWKLPQIEGQETALLGDYAVSNGSGGITWGTPTVNEIALVALEYTAQDPVGLDAPLQLLWGTPQSDNGFFTINADGSIVCTKSGKYSANTTLYFERDSSSGVAVLLVRALINGATGGLNPVGISIGSNDITIPLQFELPSITLVEGDVITYEIIRDSSGIDNGGLTGIISAGGYGNTPSAALRVQFLSDI